jgi:regulator of sirC expression with transglutaminase-like and TPR domain
MHAPRRQRCAAGTVVAVDARDRFAALFEASPIVLFEGALCIAECAAVAAAVSTRTETRRVFDRAGVERAVDRLASGVGAPILANVIEHLCEREGFAGDTDRYDDPRNSFVDHVLERRRGIPITLSVLAIEVGRRAGATLLPIGMPGHFLIGEARRGGEVGEYGDVFHGEVLESDACAALYSRLFGERRSMAPADLEPTPVPAVLARMLNNLEAGPLGRDLDALGWMLDLHCLIPDLSPADRVALANRLELLGRFDDAATQLERAGHHLGDDLGARIRARAAVCRSRRN